MVSPNEGHEQAQERRTFVPLTDMDEGGIGAEVRDMKAFAVLFRRATLYEDTLIGEDDLDNVAGLLVHLVNELDAKVHDLEARYHGKAVA